MARRRPVGLGVAFGGCNEFGDIEEHAGTCRRRFEQECASSGSTCGWHSVTFGRFFTRYRLVVGCLIFAFLHFRQGCSGELAT